MKQSAYRVRQTRQAVVDDHHFWTWLNLSTAALVAVVMAIVLFANAAVARAETGQIKIELNKLEQTDKGCRFFWLVNNQSSVELKALDLTFYWFQSDGVIGGDLKFAFAPAASKSLKVKKYMLADKTCTDFASLLLNEINQCTDTAGPVAECSKYLSYASRTKVEFLK